LEQEKRALGLHNSHNDYSQYTDLASSFVEPLVEFNTLHSPSISRMQTPSKRAADFKSPIIKSALKNSSVHNRSIKRTPKEVRITSNPPSVKMF
jgi:hypothetical protein